MEGFLTLTEFAVALAGFTSIVVVFVHKDHAWDIFDKFRIVNALWSSLGAAFLASIPHVLQYLDLSEDRIWSIEAVLIGSYIVFILVAVAIRRKTMLTPEHEKKVPQKIVNGIFVIGACFVVLLALCVVGSLAISLKGLCYFGLIYLLGIAVFAFSRIIFYRPE